MQQKKQIIIKLLIATSLLAITLSLFIINPVSAVVNPLSGNMTLVDRVGFPVVIEEGRARAGYVYIKYKKSREDEPEDLEIYT